MKYLGIPQNAGLRKKPTTHVIHAIKKHAPAAKPRALFRGNITRKRLKLRSRSSLNENQHTRTYDINHHTQGAQTPSNTKHKARQRARDSEVTAGAATRRTLKAHRRQYVGMLGRQYWQYLTVKMTSSCGHL